MATENPVGFNIKAVSERTGVPLHTLRAWERRYGVPRPSRNVENRYRLYDEKDISDVIWMKRQVDSGVSPARASAMLLQQPRGMAAATALASPQPVQGIRTALYDAFRMRDETTVHNLLNEAWSKFAPEQVVLEILQPTLTAIGDAWQRNLLSVEQEHFASNLVRQRLYTMIQAQPPAPVTAPRLVAACAPEEQHDLGLLMFTLLAKRQGWSVEYLGQRTPLAEMRTAAEGARFVVISVSTVTGLASLLPLWEGMLPSAPLLFGGDVFNLTPELREHIPGAYLDEDSVRAMRLLETTTPHISDWRPPQNLLDAARALETVRLDVVSETISRFLAPMVHMKPAELTEFRHGMTHAAMFLTDALVSALAFDAPELMDRQGAWLSGFMPARNITHDSVTHLVNLYRAAASLYLDVEVSGLIAQLLARLVHAAEATFTPPTKESRG